MGDGWLHILVMPASGRLYRDAQAMIGYMFW